MLLRPLLPDHRCLVLDEVRLRGCHNAAQLVAELRQHGFDGSYDMVRRRVASWRTRLRGVSSGKRRTKRTQPAVDRPSSNWIA